MGIFKKKKKKESIVSVEAPEEYESSKEVDYVEQLSELKTNPTEKPKEIEVIEKEEMDYREVPVCMSQAQINNLTIENNIMLKQIISEMD